ncbi:DUF1476 domain-containing protein [Methylovirgula sp. 4M-Z18]|uniref:DUF1476 domain-containing protein n=1 Tax=Methylovirgula sp. 4M-Z18 TaxID=2293567 RepID=UPI000E2EFC81|nr:DUF1476 domain-containing protein [Methylovirgula sp. 4M-Z18]RFB78556.1 DUF1476 domain-containing protein [Methylovirgula sp. 4M-Z18]
MTTFDQREKAFEDKFVHDDHMLFMAKARSLRALGLWAAKKLGKDPEEAVTYAEALVQLDIDKPGQNAVFSRIRQDFDAARLTDTDASIHKQMEDLLAQSVENLRKNG